jgi:hypothetical protein
VASPAITPNDRAFELGKHAHHLKHRSPGWRASVKPLLVKIQVAAFRMDFVEESRDQINLASWDGF